MNIVQSRRVASFQNSWAENLRLMMTAPPALSVIPTPQMPPVA